MVYKSMVDDYVKYAHVDYDAEVERREHKPGSGETSIGKASLDYDH